LVLRPRSASAALFSSTIPNIIVNNPHDPHLAFTPLLIVQPLLSRRTHSSAHEQDPRHGSCARRFQRTRDTIQPSPGRNVGIWHLNPALHSPRPAATPPMPLCGPYRGGWTRSSRVCNCQEMDRMGGRHCILLAQPDARREKKEKKSTHSFSGNEAGRSQSRISGHFDMIPYD
jgi:hypothetical protein